APVERKSRLKSAAPSASVDPKRPPPACSSSAPLPGPPAFPPSPLDDVAAALSEQYGSSEWLQPPGQPNDWRFMLAVCRAVLVAWFNPADTLPERLATAEALGRAFGLDPGAVEQVISECLLLNCCVSRQLQLQAAALAGDSFAVRPSHFPPGAEGAAAYAEFRREALLETE
ncbi:hypothetical protein Agub_g13839, partial [Astrephomene gubernaculifera]